MFLNYIKFLGVTGVACSALFAEGGGVRAVKEAKAQHYKVAPDEHFDSTSTEPHQVDQEYMPIKGRALEYLADKSKSEPATVQASKAAKNYHLKPIDPTALQIDRLSHDANTAVPGSKEEAVNLSAAAILLHQSKRLKEAAQTAWKAAIVYKNLQDYKNAARSFSKSANSFENIKAFSNAIKGYQNAGKLYQAIEKYGEAAAAFKKVGLLYENQKQYTEALKFFKLSSSVFLEAKDYNDAIDINWIMVDLYERAKNYRSAASILKEIAAIHQNNTNNLGLSAEALLKAGYYFRDAYIFDEAERSFKAALVIYRDLKFKKPEQQVMALVNSMNAKAQDVLLAENFKSIAQKKYLALKKRDVLIELHNREALQNLYIKAGTIYRKLGIASESAKAFRNAGSFSTAVTNRMKLFELAVDEYKKANMTAEMRHMEEQVGKLLTPKEQMALKVVAPLM